MQEEKRLMRRSVLAKRDALTEQQQETAAALITERVCAHEWFVTSEVILAFVSYGSEIRTDGILTKALELGKKVYVPKVEGNDINFYRLEDFMDLIEGYCGIREPEGNTECFCFTPQISKKVCMLMPGVAFDQNGNRCGYGKGFYDRFLIGKEALWSRTLGICHKCQLVEALPTEKWDVKPAKIIAI